MKKKLLLGLGTVVATVAPLASVIACGQEDFKIVDITSKDVSYISDGSSDANNSFNTAIYKGYTSSGSTQAIIGVPKGTTDLSSYYDKQIKAGKKLLVLGGFGHVNTLKTYAPKHPQNKFVLVDDEIKGIPNIASVKFSMKEIGFIAGFRMANYASLAAKKHKIGIYGAQEVGSVKEYIEGITKGIEYYVNHGKNGSSVSFSTAEYTGSFGNGGAESLRHAKEMAKDCSLVIGVGGPKYKDIIAAIKDPSNSSTAKVVGVDFNLKNILSDNNDKDHVWGSILKNLTITTKKVIDDMKEDFREHVGKTYTGDISNDGTGLIVGDDSLNKKDKFAITQDMFENSNLNPTFVIEEATKFSKA